MYINTINNLSLWWFQVVRHNRRKQTCAIMVPPQTSLFTVKTGSPALATASESVIVAFCIFLAYFFVF